MRRAAKATPPLEVVYVVELGNHRSRIAGGHGKDYALTIHEAGDENWYQWTAPSNGAVTIDILFSDDAGDLELELWGANQIAGQIDVSLWSTDDERVSAKVLAGSTYNVRVYGSSHILPLPTNSYDLAIRLIPTDQFEPNDSFTSPTDLGTDNQSLSDLTIQLGCRGYDKPNPRLGFC